MSRTPHLEVAELTSHAASGVAWLTTYWPLSLKQRFSGRTSVMINKTRMAGFAAALAAGAAHADFSFDAPGGQSLSLTGYLREHMAVNLEDHPEASAKGTRLDGKGEISMLRSTFRLEAKADVKWAQFVGVYRLDREEETGYLSHLNDAVRANNTANGVVSGRQQLPGRHRRRPDGASGTPPSTSVTACTPRWASSKWCGARRIFSAPWTSSTATTCAGARSWRPKTRNCASR